MKQISSSNILFYEDRRIGKPNDKQDYCNRFWQNVKQVNQKFKCLMKSEKNNLKDDRIVTWTASKKAYRIIFIRKMGIKLEGRKVCSDWVTFSVGSCDSWIRNTI